MVRVLFASVIGAVLLLAGCGDDDESAEPASSASAADSTTSSGSTSTLSSTTEMTTDSSGSTAEPPGPTIDVYFSVGDGSDCGEVRPFRRGVADDFDRYRSTFQQLVAGPTEEEEGSGAGSFFSSATADVVKSAVLTDDLLTVDFAELQALLPNASTSCGSQALLAQLNSTAFQFGSVHRTRYLIEGSCNDFGNWLQRHCFETDRSGQELEVPTTDRADGAGCTPPSTDSLSAGRWFGFVPDAQAEQLSFDLACWFTGAAAETAAAEDGAESPPPNDYHIRNESDRVRIHFVDSATEVEWLPNPGDPGSVEVVPYTTWLVERVTRAHQPGVWLTVEDDSQVIRIEEQYVP